MCFAPRLCHVWRRSTVLIQKRKGISSRIRGVKALHHGSTSDAVFLAKNAIAHRRLKRVAILVECLEIMDAHETAPTDFYSANRAGTCRNLVVNRLGLDAKKFSGFRDGKGKTMLELGRKGQHNAAMLYAP